MNKFKADYDKKQTFQLSNDAFYFLYCGEEPLDEDNIEEALEIQGLFPNGFIIEDNWTAVEDSDLIEATFVPYVAEEVEEIDYDESLNLSKYVQLQIKWVGPDLIKVWWSDLEKGTRELRGECSVLVNDFKLKYFKLEECVFYLKHFVKA